MNENQINTESNVTNKLQIYKDCNYIVTRLIEIRTSAGFTQQFMADWLDVSRKKINEFEQGKFDFDLMVSYADKLSVDIKLKIEIN